MKQFFEKRKVFLVIILSVLVAGGFIIKQQGQPNQNKEIMILQKEIETLKLQQSFPSVEPQATEKIVEKNVTLPKSTIPTLDIKPSSIPTPTFVPTPTPTPTPSTTTTINYGDLPLGETGFLGSVWWNFGVNYFKSLYANITIYAEPSNNDGLYFQMYQGKINNVVFYFGLQTKISNPNTGTKDKGLIFSRWDTRDLSNVKTVEGGWSESAGYEGDFVSIRKHYEWATHSYKFKIAYIESDDVGDWYGVWIYDLNNSTEDFLGSIRFPSTEPSKSGIANGGGTWIELYSKEIKQTPIPSWHVSIDGIYANESMISPKSATSAYSDITHSDIYYDYLTKKIHFLMGPEVITEEHNAGKLF